MPWTTGLLIGKSIEPSGHASTFNTTTNMFGGAKISTRMAIGPTRRITAGYGVHAMFRSVLTVIGRRIVMVIGSGALPMVGAGSEMSHGAGHPTTTVAGSSTTATGPGVRAASINGGVGGVPPWWPFSSSTSRSEIL